MEPILRYLVIPLTAGGLGLVSGLWIARQDPPERAADFDKKLAD
jgi:hypothetical protein